MLMLACEVDGSGVKSKWQKECEVVQNPEKREAFKYPKKKRECAASCVETESEDQASREVDEKQETELLGTSDVVAVC